MIKNNDPLFIRIADLLKNQGKTQKELTDHLGITSNAFTDWKSGRLKSYQKYLYEIASFLGVSVAYLKGETDVPNARPSIFDIAKAGAVYDDLKDIPLDDMPREISSYTVSHNGLLLNSSKFFPIPVYESVSAGFGAYANENIIDYKLISLSSAEEAKNTLFVKVTGDSMEPKIEDGDLIQVYKTDSVDSGTIAVVMMDSVDGEEAFVKKVVYGHGWVELHSINPKYAPLRFEKNDIDRIRILGEVTSIVRGV